MFGLLILWWILIIVTTVSMCCRWSWMFYVIGLLPILLTAAFFIFRNMPVEGENKLNFFSGFKIGGHRGSPQMAPENTIAAFEKALEEKAQLVEFDIQLSADFVPIIMHDDDTTRTGQTNIKISTSQAKDILEVQLKSVNGTNATIPTLNETVLWCIDKKMKMLFDVKNADQKLITHMVNIIQQHDLYSSVIISSFNPLVSFLVKRRDPKILTGFTSRRLYYSDNVANGSYLTQLAYQVADDLMFMAIRTFALPRFLGVDMLLLQLNDINHELVREAGEYSMKVVAWTVNDETVAKFATEYLQIPILTDVPGKMMQ